MTFDNEKLFEDNLIKVLIDKWRSEKILMYPTEEELINNWSNILFENNREIDRLNNTPLTPWEMNQILNQVKRLETPLNLNEFLNGKEVNIIRDNPDDKLHIWKTVSLKIYDRSEIAWWDSRYQIARQPKFMWKDPVLWDRRWDVMLLINWMPVIHIELKKSGISITEPFYQIGKYLHEGIFSGIFSLIQVFVAMTPEDSVYFANPGSFEKLNRDFAFHREDTNNELIHDWRKFTEWLLNIPMAHQLIWFYTIPDRLSNELKVMRSYQIYAARAISEKVEKITDWNVPKQRWWYVRHTTWSWKTMTSFKTAQLIVDAKLADKAVFLVDRIELGNQTFLAFNWFAWVSNPWDNEHIIEEAKNTHDLIWKLKNDKVNDRIIIASIQKMSNLKIWDIKLQWDIETINKKRIVFIIDEAHRDTFGDMLSDIKEAFPKAIFFWFTGTPIVEEHKKNWATIADVFGSELCRYTIADWIRDWNVLWFDPYRVSTYSDYDLRLAVALDKAKVHSEEEAMDWWKRQEVFLYYMQEASMLEIENNISSEQYRRKEHQEKVVEDICKKWNILSRNWKFHAIFAASSINEAIQYYRLFKEKKPELKTTVLVDKNIDYNEDLAFKEDWLKEIIDDFNIRYNQTFTLASYADMKKDVSLRLAHKNLYSLIQEKDIVNLLIVVDQMLTWFDSKRVNTLYLDKVLQYETIIQAFSRTNRIFWKEKPFGIIKYYRRPYTMKKNIEDAIKAYSWDRPFDLFVSKIVQNIKALNDYYWEIDELFTSEEINDFEKTPESLESQAKFTQLFVKLSNSLESAKLQWFSWNKKEYTSEDFQNIDWEKWEDVETIEVKFTKNEYSALHKRYQESVENLRKHTKTIIDPIPLSYEIDANLMEINDEKYDYAYMNKNFEKYLKALQQKNVSQDELESILNTLHKSFAFMSQEKQKFARFFLNDVENWKQLEAWKTFSDYITEYQHASEDKEFRKVVDLFCLDSNKLKEMVDLWVNENTINEFERFNILLDTIDWKQAKFSMEKISWIPLTERQVKVKTRKFLREYILNWWHIEWHIEWLIDDE